MGGMDVGMGRVLQTRGSQGRLLVHFLVNSQGRRYVLRINHGCLEDSWHVCRCRLIGFLWHIGSGTLPWTRHDGMAAWGLCVGCHC